MRAAALLPVVPVLLAVACAVDGPAPAPQAAEPVDVAAAEEPPEELWEEDVHDGPWLYERNCSGCHGMEGKGDGQTGKDLGVQPRDFAAGGFSFGNTREDLFRTIGAGIPGRSVMPAFGGLLSEEERWLVVDHVLTLMPPQERQDPRASVLHVTDRAALARGKLPPAAEGRRELPRGLLLGLPSGLTFEYDVSDVAPVAVRLGAFADREDWRGRGGGYLKALGQPIYLGSRAPAFTYGAGPASARLTASWTDGDTAGLEYELSSGGARLAKVVERLRAVPLSAGGAFRRELEVTGLAIGATNVDLYVAGDERTRFDRAQGRWYSGPRDVGADGAQDCEAVWLEFESGRASASIESGALRVRLDLPPGATTRIAATVVLIPEYDAERLAALAEEIAR